jgi:hypothetical protein
MKPSPFSNLRNLEQRLYDAGYAPGMEEEEMLEEEFLEQERMREFNDQRRREYDEMERAYEESGRGISRMNREEQRMFEEERRMREFEEMERAYQEEQRGREQERFYQEQQSRREQERFYQEQQSRREQEMREMERAYEGTNYTYQRDNLYNVSPAEVERLLEMDDKTLLDTLISNKNLSRFTKDPLNDKFWHERFLDKFPFAQLEKYKNNQRPWRNFYLVILNLMILGDAKKSQEQARSQDSDVYALFRDPIIVTYINTGYFPQQQKEFDEMEKIYQEESKRKDDDERERKRRETEQMERSYQEEERMREEQRRRETERMERAYEEEEKKQEQPQADQKREDGEGFNKPIFLEEPMINFLSSANFGNLPGTDTSVRELLLPLLENHVLSRDILTRLFTLYMQANVKVDGDKILSLKYVDPVDKKTYFRVDSVMEQYLGDYLTELEREDRNKPIQKDNRGNIVPRFDRNKFTFNKLHSIMNKGIVPTKELYPEALTFLQRQDIKDQLSQVREVLNSTRENKQKGENKESALELATESDNVELLKYLSQEELDNRLKRAALNNDILQVDELLNYTDKYVVREALKLALENGDYSKKVANYLMKYLASKKYRF